MGGHICDGWKECEKEIGFADPYRLAIHSLLKNSLSIPGYTGTTILRSFAPDHFEGGAWDSGGRCVRTTPGGVSISSLTNWMYEIQTEEFQNVTGKNLLFHSISGTAISTATLLNLKPDHGVLKIQRFLNQISYHVCITALLSAPF